MKTLFFPLLAIVLTFADFSKAEPNCPTVPTSLPATQNQRLPNPFVSVDGTNVTTKEQWACRREEIKTLLQRYELGILPPKPSNISATFSNNTVTITCSEGGRTITFKVKIAPPTSGQAGPVPAILAFGGSSIPIPSNIALITLNNDEIAQQSSQSSRGKGKFFDLYGSSYNAGSVIGWSWAVSRVIDALELLPESETGIDAAKLGLTGCSRNGKGVLVAAAFEDRIKLAIPQESGRGGSSCWRIEAQECKQRGIGIEEPEEQPWFSKTFDQYRRNYNVLPYDHHMLIGLIASQNRGLLIIENWIDWLCPSGTFTCSMAGWEIFKALGVRENFGYTSGGHSHCQFPVSEAPELGAFIGMFLLDETVATGGVYENKGNFSVNRSWINWGTPTLT